MAQSTESNARDVPTGLPLVTIDGTGNIGRTGSMPAAYGYETGLEDGAAIGRAAGFAAGWPLGLARGQDEGDEEARADAELLRLVVLPPGYGAGYDDGMTDGAGAAKALGIAYGIARGYDEGLRDGLDEGSVGAFPAAFGAGTMATPVAETDPPEVGTTTPDQNEAPGSAGAFPATYAAAKDTPVIIPVVDAASAIAFVVLSTLRDGRWELIYAGRPAIDGYRAGYETYSNLSGNGDPGVGFTFTVRNNTGWPGTPTLASELKIDINAVDEKGNVLA